MVSSKERIESAYRARAGKARRQFRQLVSGAPDEHRRLWFRELEVLERDGNISYEPTYFIDEAVWRSSLGYARLYEDKSPRPFGARAIYFGYHYTDLEVTAVNDHLSTETRLALRNSELAYLITAKNPRRIFNAADIKMAIERHADALGKAIRLGTVLYETDYIKGVYRSLGAAYRFIFEDDDESFDHVQERRVKGILFYHRFYTDDKSFVNPFGDNLKDRVYRRFDHGIDLLEGKPSMSREEAEEFVEHHYQQAIRRFRHNESSAHSHELLSHKKYVMMISLVQLIMASLDGNRRRWRNFSLARAAQLRSLAGSGFSALRSLVELSPYLLVYAGISVVLGAVGFLKKPAIDEQALLDLNDPNAQKLSYPSKLIEPFHTLLRPAKDELFEPGNKGTMLLQPVFEKGMPAGIRYEKSLNNWPAGLIQPSLQERNGSIVRLPYEKDAIPDDHPIDLVKAKHMKRADGIVVVDFDSEDIAWAINTGHPPDPKAAEPHPALLKRMKDGYVLELYRNHDNLGRPSQTHTRLVPYAEAEQRFQERFGRPLLSSRERERHVPKATLIGAQNGAINGTPARVATKPAPDIVQIPVSDVPTGRSSRVRKPRPSPSGTASPQ